MNIVLCNKYFFLNGGTEKYLSILLQHLPACGHSAIPFSVRYAGSWESPYSDYFLEPPADPWQTHLHKIKLTPANCIRFLSRSIYSRTAQHALEKLLEAVGLVDIGYVLNIYNYMSPSIISTFYRRGIPVVMHVGDYHLICPAYTLLRNNRPCIQCITGNYYHGLVYRCVKKNFPASAVRVVGMYIQKWLRIYDHVSAFIVPCFFMKTMLSTAGFPAERIHVIRYPVAPENLPVPQPKQQYMLYFGRLSREKGVDTLLSAYQRCAPPADLVIAGRSYDGEQERLRSLILPAFRSRIRFCGFVQGAQLSQLISQALFSVVPSRWYDNAPLSIYESFAHYTPVVGAAIGGIPEQIEDMVTGRLFPPDNVAELADRISWMLANSKRLEDMGRAGRAFVEQHLGVDRHLHELTTLFRSVRS